MTNRFLKMNVGLLAILYPVASYLLAFFLGAKGPEAYLPLLGSSLVHACWLYHFCEEEWLGFRPSLFWIPICITTAFTIYWAGTYFLSYFQTGSNKSSVTSVLIQCLLLYVCSVLPYAAGVIARKVKDHLLIIPTYRRPSPLVVAIYALVITTPLLYLVTALGVEIYFVSAGYQGESLYALATPDYILAGETVFFACLFYAGFPLSLLARYLCKRKPKEKPQPFKYG